MGVGEVDVIVVMVVFVFGGFCGLSVVDFDVSEEG